jgi:hypothetical protein
MKLTQIAIGRIKDPDIRRELTNVLLCTDQTIIRYIKANEQNSPLTTIAAINKIKECTGLTEGEILEQEGEPVHAGK